MLDNIFLAFTISAFVVYRISRMMALEEGPFDIFVEWRQGMWKLFPVPWIQNGTGCPLCISFWVSIPVAIILLFILQLYWYEFFFLWLGLSGAASFLYRMEQ